MRILDACQNAIRTLAISPNSRYLAASADQMFVVLDWITGEPHLRTDDREICEQCIFDPRGNWLARGAAGQKISLVSLDSAPPPVDIPGEFSGGLAVSPDCKMLVATRAGRPNLVMLSRWSLPSFQPLSGFDFWSPFRRLAFSTNGEFLAGIWPGQAHRYLPEHAGFELRFAHSGGLDYRYRPRDRRHFDSTGFISFTRDSGTCAFGWEREFHVLDLATGTSRYLRRVETNYRDAAFTGSGHSFATVEESGVLKLWDVRTWQVMHEYDWGCGPLTCLAFTADGSAGVCGTADGRLVQFDIDE